MLLHQNLRDSDISSYISSYKMDGKKGFFILVFGGTSGIGFCVAEAALEQGASVFISGSNPNKLTSALTSLIEAYPTARRVTSPWQRS
jgi:short-subunit dehydrogenase involved in D-alanine esterification of teichoic acids